MNRRSAAIARSLFWDALILLALSVYELCVRLDAMWGPLKMFVNMAVGEGIPLRRVVTYVDITIFYVPLYMLLCAVVALCALASRRTRRTCARLLLPCAALAEEDGEFGFDFGDEGYTGEWVRVDGMSLEFCLPEGWEQTGEAAYAATDDAGNTVALTITIAEAVSIIREMQEKKARKKK